MRHSNFWLSAVAMAALTLAPQAIAQDSNAAQEIVVTARSLKDTADALAECLARKCPPDEDVAATLAHAENQFIAGDYTNARATLLRSAGRNRKHGKAYPVPVSDLFRASSRVAEHVGEARSFQTSVLTMRDTLKAGVGPNDPRTLVAQIEVGDSRAKLGFPDEADRIYESVEKQAIGLNQNRVAMFARFRQALLQQTISKENGIAAEKTKARAMFEDIVANPLPGATEFSLAAKLVLAKSDREAGKSDTTEAILRDFAAAGGTARPVLLFADPIKMPEQAPANISERLATNNNIQRWADVGFWVNADGKISDLEILRGSKSRDWLDPVLTHLKTRVYAPLKGEGTAGSPGFYMIERYSLTARWGDTNDSTGTRLRVRDPNVRIERLDLTPDTVAPPADAE